MNRKKTPKLEDMVWGPVAFVARFRDKFLIINTEYSTPGTS